MRVEKVKHIFEGENIRRVSYQIHISDLKGMDIFKKELETLIAELQLEKFFTITKEYNEQAALFDLRSLTNEENCEDIISTFIQKAKEKAEKFEPIGILYTEIEKLKKNFNCLITILLNKKILKEKDIISKAKPLKEKENSSDFFFTFPPIKVPNWVISGIASFLLGLFFGLFVSSKSEYKEIYVYKTDTLYINQYLRDTVYLRQTKTYYETTYVYQEKIRRDTLVNIKTEKIKEFIRQPEKLVNLGAYIQNDFPKKDLSGGLYTKLNFKSLKLEGGIKYHKDFKPFITIRLEK